MANNIDFDSRPNTNENDELEAGNDGLSLIAVGDIVLDLGVGRTIRKKGPSYPFEHISDFLATADIVFGNLEGPISCNRTNPLKGKRINFCADPVCAELLRYGNFNIVNLANNHTMDYGELALCDTIRILAKMNIKYIGAGRNLEEARQPAIFKINGKRVAFLGYATPDEKTNATHTQAGTAPFLLEYVINDLEHLKKKADVLIVSVHKGREFVFYPHPDHQSDCRKIIKAGADIILGHHPHVPQGIEWFNDGLIIYSLGEFLSDFEPPLTRFENHLFLETKKNNFIGVFKITPTGSASVNIYPKHQGKDFQVRLLPDSDNRNTLRLIEKLSTALNRKRLNDAYWKESKNYILTQLPAVIHGIKDGRISFMNFFRWILKDETMKIIFGSFFRIILSDTMLAKKNYLLRTIAKNFNYSN